MDAKMDVIEENKLKTSPGDQQQNTVSASRPTEPKSGAANKIDSIRKIAGNLSGGGMARALDALEDRQLFERTEAAKKSSDQTATLLKSKL